MWEAVELCETQQRYLLSSLLPILLLQICSSFPLIIFWNPLCLKQLPVWSLKTDSNVFCGGVKWARQRQGFPGLTRIWLKITHLCGCAVNRVRVTVERTLNANGGKKVAISLKYQTIFRIWYLHALTLRCTLSHFLLTRPDWINFYQAGFHCGYSIGRVSTAWLGTGNSFKSHISTRFHPLQRCRWQSG